MNARVFRQKLPALRVAELSTAHLCPKDLRLFQVEDMTGISLRGKFGALVYLPHDGELDTRAVAGFSDTFLDILGIAAAQGFTHIRFDSDAPIVSGLATFE